MEPPSKRPRLSEQQRRVSPPPPKRTEPSQDTPMARKFLPSPFHLSRIRDLPESLNVDSLSLKDILGHPLVHTVYSFNYLHDVAFTLAALDEDVRHLVKLHIVHGFWKNEDGAGLKEQAKQMQNVTLHCAYMPERFGTHHSKMLIVFRQDDVAQVTIHTANMIERDWTNMTNAIWQSPVLPLRQDFDKSHSSEASSMQLGSGHRFKRDLISYLSAYGNANRTILKDLVSKIKHYDFSDVKGALIASTPQTVSPESDLFGWTGLRNSLRQLSMQEGQSTVISQVSSIASIGKLWLEKSLFQAFGASKNKTSKPQCKVIFPTADEIRRSLDGYSSGHSIHTKIEGRNAGQVQYLLPMLHLWAGDGPSAISCDRHNIREAGRRRAAPHIKTYVRLNENGTIDWALTTSANLSKQAWGEAASQSGHVKIASYEIGVLIWPQLYGDNAQMVPTFKQDLPNDEMTLNAETKTVVGLRMPYDLPIIRYNHDDLPWCATSDYLELDWKGETWVHRAE